MLFQPYLCVLIFKKIKTRTRREKKDNEYLWQNPLSGAHEVRCKLANGRSRVKWRVGQSYAVQPGRCQRQIGRVLITMIREERLLDISADEIQREGMLPYVDNPTNEELFQAWKTCWIQINGKKSWDRNPSLWVLGIMVINTYNNRIMRAILRGFGTR